MLYFGKRLLKDNYTPLFLITLGLVWLPEGCKVIGSKWIFKKKLRYDCTIDKYKARLCD